MDDGLAVTMDDQRCTEIANLIKDIVAIIVKEFKGFGEQEMNRINEVAITTLTNKIF